MPRSRNIADVSERHLVSTSTFLLEACLPGVFSVTLTRARSSRLHMNMLGRGYRMKIVAVTVYFLVSPFTPTRISKLTLSLRMNGIIVVRNVTYA